MKFTVVLVPNNKTKLVRRQENQTGGLKINKSKSKTAMYLNFFESKPGGEEVMNEYSNAS